MHSVDSHDKNTMVQEFFDLSEDLMLVAKPNGLILRMSASWEPVLGYGIEEMKGTHIFSWAMGESLAQMQLAFEQALANHKGKQPEILEACYRGKNGVAKLLSWRIKSAGNGKKVYCIAKDITKQRRTDLAIQSIRQGLSAKIGTDFFEQMAKAMATTVNADYAFIGKVLGHKVSTIALCHNGEIIENFSYDLPGTPCKDILSGDACRFSEGVALLYPHDLLLQQMRIEGYIGIPLHDSNKKPIGLLVALFQNGIEDADFAENIMRIFSSRASSELERMQVMQQVQQLAHIAEQTDNAVVVANRERRIEWVNQGFVNMTGYTLEDVQGRKAEAFLEGSQAGFKRRRHIWENLTQGKPVQVEAMNYRKDGKKIWVEVNIQPIFDRHGRIDHYISIQRDITERKAYEQTLQQQNEELKKANQELDAFVYRVSHDLRAPLTSAMGLLELMGQEQDLAVLRSYTELLGRSLDKQDAFIQDILTYSRNARQEVRAEPVDFHDLLAQVVGQVAHIPDFRKMRCEVKVQQSGEFISDGHRLQVVLGNLVSNAVRYSNPYIDEPFVEISVEANEKQAKIKIADNGIGIGAEHIEKIFLMFYRATDRKNGSGLGLYLVKDAVERMQGRVSVQSKLGEGTTFELAIPNKKA